MLSPKSKYLIPHTSSAYSRFFISSVTKDPMIERLKIKNRKALNNRLYPWPEERNAEVPHYDISTKNPISRVYVWGFASYGALGIPEYLEPIKRAYKKYKKDGTFKAITSRHHPVRCSYVETQGVKDISCGFGFTLFVVKDGGGLMGTGINKEGQIGHHLDKNKKLLDVITRPSPINLPEGIKASKVSCGRAHSIIVSNDGHVLTLGSNSYGQCGRPIVKEEDYFTNQVTHILNNNVFNGDKIKYVYAGQDHSLFLSDAGQVYGCGWSADGQTGLEHFNNQEEVQQVKGDIDGEKIVKLACSADCALALNDNGQVFGWGNAEYGQFHFVTEEQQLNRPTNLPLKKYGKIIDIAAGGSICLILNEDHELFVWGFGILGNTTTADFSKVPIKLSSNLFGRSELEPNIYISKIFSGIGTNAVINNEGDLYVWGANREGCLGLGKLKGDKYCPSKVLLSERVKKVSLGVDHSAALC